MFLVIHVFKIYSPVLDWFPDVYHFMLIVDNVEGLVLETETTLKRKFNTSTHQTQRLTQLVDTRAAIDRQTIEADT